MKKFMLFAVAMLMSLCSYAGKPVKVLQGSTEFMKTDASISVVLDWADAQWDNKMPLNEQLKDDYNPYLNVAETSVVAGFNDKSKKAVATKSQDEANYVMTIRVTNCDKFFSAMSLVPGYITKVWGIVDVVDKATGETVCKLTINELEGDRDFTVDDSWKKCFVSLGRAIAKAK